MTIDEAVAVLRRWRDREGDRSERDDITAPERGEAMGKAWAFARAIEILHQVDQ